MDEIVKVSGYLPGRTPQPGDLEMRVGGGLERDQARLHPAGDIQLLFQAGPFNGDLMETGVFDGDSCGIRH